jgi:NADP-dependent 3-hydroxy acid dehydrogenase YdfG
LPTIAVGAGRRRWVRRGGKAVVMTVVAGHGRSVPKAVVTGASGGIGSAISVELLAAGFDVALIGRSAEKLAAVEVAAGTPSGRTCVVGCDFTDLADVLEVSDFLSREWTPLDVVVHSAGAIVLENVEQAALSDLDLMLDVNLRAPVLLTQRLLPAMDVGGSIVFVNSTAGLRTSPHNTFYSATKHALKALADGLRSSVGSRNIRVLSVYPSLTATSMGRYVKRYYGSAYEPAQLVQPHEIATAVREWILDRGDDRTDIVFPDPGAE